MSNVVSLSWFREVKKLEASDYKSRIQKMDKLDLLEEMVRFQEWRSREGNLTVQMCVEGKVLFKALVNCAETPEMKVLTKSYLQNLELNLEDLRKKA